MCTIIVSLRTNRGGSWRSSAVFWQLRRVVARLGGRVFPRRVSPSRCWWVLQQGEAADVGARILASGLEKELGTPVVVVNKPGASGQIGYTALAQAKPDGYTIGNTNFPVLRRHLPGSGAEGHLQPEELSSSWRCT